VRRRQEIQSNTLDAPEILQKYSINFMQQIKLTVHVINFLSRTFVCLGIFEGKCFPSNYQKNYLTRKLLLEKELRAL
jgi:hypothetical protein